mmetsp:Transcript_36025/g.84485  ORF Transcript_36025/g.84485 Transcript_36025/m.84485 type:complete len:100 (-) Transcript_36025:1170-1469(-)
MSKLAEGWIAGLQAPQQLVERRSNVLLLAALVKEGVVLNSLGLGAWWPGYPHTPAEPPHSQAAEEEQRRPDHLAMACRSASSKVEASRPESSQLASHGG